MSNLYIGVMSGTSLDGVDVALCEIDATTITLLNYDEFPFPKELKENILQTLTQAITLKEFAVLDHKLGVLFCQSILQFLQKHAIDSYAIEAIGLHGQTLWHEPSLLTPISLQLGDANIVATNTNITTITDFRRMDIANGGEGAPFAPLFHHFLFSKLKENVAVVNIGGMANITFLSRPLEGFDIGCGNVLLDLWMQKSSGRAYDRDGAFAKTGTLRPELLAAMLQDPYFSKLPPKSTGREYFNEAWLDSFLPHFQTYKDEDIQRTLLELVACTISQALKEKDTTLLILCGGGTKNSFLFQRIDALTTCDVKKSDDFGIKSDALEAMAFAWFAQKRLCKEKLNLTSVTGAKKESLLGAIYG